MEKLLALKNVAYLIGINDYLHDMNDIEDCKNDLMEGEGYTSEEADEYIKQRVLRSAIIREIGSDIDKVSEAIINEMVERNSCIHIQAIWFDKDYHDHNDYHIYRIYHYDWNQAVDMIIELLTIDGHIK